MQKSFEWPPAPTYRIQEPVVLPVAQTVVWHNPRWGAVEGTGRTLFTVLDRSGDGWVGRGNGAQEDDAETLKSVDRVLGLLGRGRF